VLKKNCTKVDYKRIRPNTRLAHSGVTVVVVVGGGKNNTNPDRS
jgi:hypothetical protein